MLEDRFKVRRRQAKTSFVVVNVLVFLVLGIVFFGSPLVAANLTAATPLLMTLVGALVGIIGHYNHMVYSTDKTKGENDVETDK